jgi:succinate dehydrogenase / fumarate reductase membrane anchor subunit
MSGGLQGFNAWVLQRITAVLLVFASIALLFLVFFPPGPSFNDWQDWVGRPLTVISIAVFVIALIAHAWVGVRDVIVDYVHPHGLRLLALSMLGVYLLGNLVWSLWILL